MTIDTPEQRARLREMADQLECFTEEDFQSLANATPKTVEAWRKRGKGPAYILIGRRYLYPRKAVAEYINGLIRDAGQPARELRGRSNPLD